MKKRLVYGLYRALATEKLVETVANEQDPRSNASRMEKKSKDGLPSRQYGCPLLLARQLPEKHAKVMKSVGA
jgi:hypothetical protein